MIRPLLQCCAPTGPGRCCSRIFDERDAVRRRNTPHAGRLVAPHCYHGLQHAVYIDPATGTILRRYSDG